MTATVEREIAAGRERIVEILSDGWNYPTWVVGACRMRRVDGHWPQQGARLHHSVGVWPLVIDDSTDVVENALPDRLVLRARASVFGRAQITLEVESLGNRRCRVRMSEQVMDHLGKALPTMITDPPIVWRNTEVLGRLDALATRPSG